MAEVYSTPTNSSSGPTEEASLDVLAQEEMDGMVSRLKSLVEVALGQAHSPKMLVGFNPKAETRSERSS